jgi:hypothetical protein
MSPVISVCEKIVSRIIPKEINRHQPASAEECCNSDNTNRINNSYKTSRQTLTTESTDQKHGCHIFFFSKYCLS